MDFPIPRDGIRLSVSGRATVFDGSGAQLDVRRGEELLGSLRFPEGAASTQEITLTALEPGIASLDLVFANDAVDGNRDRNLYIDTVAAHAVRRDATAKIEAMVRERLRQASVVLVSIDTLRADHLGCYGYERNTSPTIDALARLGTRFSRAASSSTWTLPSHASLMTGRHLDEHGLRSPDVLRRLPADLPSLAAELRRAGYATGGFAGGRWITPRFGFDRGFDVFQNDVDWEASVQDHAHRGEAAAAWVESLPQERPYFLFVHYYQVHAPYWSPPETRGRFLHGVPARKSAASPYEGGMRSQEDLEHQVALYDEDIAAVDLGLERLLRELKRVRPGDSPLVVVTSDHGEEFFDHGGTGHGQPHREVLHTPLIFSHPALPGLTPPVIDTPVGSVRVAPTIAELVGLGDSALPMERSMVGLLTGAVEPEAEALAGSSDAEAGYRVLWADGTSIVEWRDRVRVHAAPRLTAEDVDTAIADPIELGSARSRLDATFGGLEPVGTWTEIKLDETTETQLRALGYLR